MPNLMPSEKDIYVIKGDRGLESAVEVAEADEVGVAYFARGGGFLQRSSLENFLQRREFVPPERLAELVNEYRPARFLGEWFPEDAPAMEGFTNGTMWNGWEVPVFTREAIEVALEAGHLCDRKFGTFGFFDEGRDAFILVIDHAGEGLPDELDQAAVLAMLDRGETETDNLMVGDYPGRDVTVEGEARRVYPFGDGWCWTPAPEPNATPGP